MSKNKLAIVIPYYKITYFEDTLKSLSNQTNKNFSLYIGNDNSPENPQILIEKYSNIITNYLDFESNIGGFSLTKQWERCIDNLVQDEEWIMILCDDDLVDERVVEKFYDLNNLDKYNLIKYATKVVDEKAINVLGIYLNNEIENSINYITNKIINKKRSTLSEHIFNKKVYEKFKFKDFELAFGSDDVAWVEFTNGGQILCINDAFVYYRKSILSISINPDKALKSKKMKGIISSYKYILLKYYKLMTIEQKEIFLSCIYFYNRALNRSNILSQFEIIIIILKILGLKKCIKIILNNRNYYEKYK